MRALHPITPAQLPEVLLRVALARPVHLWGAPGIGKSTPQPRHHAMKPKVVHMDASWADAYPTISQMTTASDAVVVGTVGSVQDVTQRGGITYTDFTVQVNQWIKGGSASTLTILIHQTGGTVDGTTMVSDDDPLLVPGEQDVFYLHQYAPGKYFTLGGPTGRLSVNDGTVSALPSGIATDGLPARLSTFTARVVSLVAAAAAK